MCGISAVFTGVINCTNKVFKDSDTMRSVIAGVAATIRTVSVYHPFVLPSKLLDTITAIDDFVFATRIFSSIAYFGNGKIFGSIVAKPLIALAHTCYLFARIGTVVNWLIQQSLIDLGRIASQVASIPTYGQALISLASKPIVEILFLVGMGAFALQRIGSLANGADLAFKIADLACYASEMGILGCIISGAATSLIGPLGIAAAVTGVAAFLLKS